MWLCLLAAPPDENEKESKTKALSQGNHDVSQDWRWKRWMSRWMRR